MTGRSMTAHNEGFKSGERAGRLAAAEEIEQLRGELERARGLLTLTLHTENSVPAQRVLDEEVYRGLQEAMVLIGAKNDNVSEAVKASNINTAWHILDRIISDGGAPVYCAHCDHEHPLHEDARGFHHVIRGERVPCCSVPSTDNSGAK